MMKISSLFFLLLSINMLFCQKTFQRVYSGKMILHDTRLTKDGGVLIVGEGPFYSPSDESYTLHDAGIIKLDADYQVEWAHCFKSLGIQRDVFYSALEWNNHYYVLGEAGKDKDVVLIKLNINSEEVWTKVLPSRGSILKLKVLNDQLYVLVRTNSYEGGFYVMNEDGEVQKNRFYSLDSNFRDIIEYKGEFYLLGNILKDDGDLNVIVSKLDTDHRPIWLKEYKSSFLEGSKYRRGSHNLCVLGGDLYFSSYREVVSGVQGNELVIFKLNQEGELLLVKRWSNAPGFFTGEFLGVYDDSLILGYSAKPESSSSKPGMLIINKNLEVIKNIGYQFERYNLESIYSLNIEENGLLIGGIQYPYNDNYEGCYLIKTTFDGNTSCTQFWQSFEEKDVTHQYEESNLSFNVFPIGTEIIDFEWGSTYATNDSILYNCEKEYFFSKELTEGPYCDGDTIKLEQYIPKGEQVNWDISFEDMIEETESYVSFIVGEDSLIEAVAEFSGEVYERKLSLGCPPGSDLIVNQTWSPNNDGLNDYFEIKNLDYYPDHKVLLINRFGEKVFEQQNYQNNWQGDGLTNGVYQYFIFRDNNDLEPEEGVIIVNY